MITKAQETTEKLESNGREPQWLTDSRRHAWQQYENIPVPTLKDDLWRHTDLSKLDFSIFTSGDIETRATSSIKVDTPVTSSIEEEAVAAQTGFLADSLLAKLLSIFNSASFIVSSPANPIVCRDAQLSVSLKSEARDKGVVITDLASACREYPELVRKHLEAFRTELFDKDKFFTLNTALFDESVFIYVPPDTKLTSPLISAFELGTGEGTFPKLVVVADQGSEFKLVNMLSSSQNCFAAGVVQLSIGPNANVSYLEVQNFKEEVTSITRTIHQISADARFTSLTLATGGSTVKSDILTELKKPGGQAKILGIVLGSGNEHYDFNTIIDHQAPDTVSDINFRVALQDVSSSVYQGTIKIDKHAQRTLAYQSNKNLLLSDRAHAASIPKLEILANDVKCSHGATVAAVDKDQLFYLSSRGLDTTQAEQLIVSGFFNQVVESFGWAEITPWLESMLTEKLLG